MWSQKTKKSAGTTIGEAMAIWGRETLVSFTIGKYVWYEPRDINHTIYFNEDVKKRLSKLSKDVSIHATLKKNEVWLL